MYVVIGMHKVLPERLDDYLANVKRHAANSAGEPGCPRYEVLQDADDPTIFCLFEVFQDEGAFLAHRETQHYNWWMELSKDWRDGGVLSRHVMSFVTPDPA